MAGSSSEQKHCYLSVADGHDGRRQKQGGRNLALATEVKPLQFDTVLHQHHWPFVYMSAMSEVICQGDDQQP